MSKRTYIGDPKGFADDWSVQQDPKDELYYIMVTERVPCDCGCPRCTAYEEIKRKHSSHVSGSWPGFPEYEDAVETIQAMEQDIEDDYDSYLEENHYEIVQMERYEQWRNEF